MSFDGNHCCCCFKSEKVSPIISRHSSLKTEISDGILEAIQDAVIVKQPKPAVNRVAHSDYRMRRRSYANYYQQQLSRLKRVERRRRQVVDDETAKQWRKVNARNSKSAWAKVRNLRKAYRRPKTTSSTPRNRLSQKVVKSVATTSFSDSREKSLNIFDSESSTEEETEVQEEEDEFVSIDVGDFAPEPVAPVDETPAITVESEFERQSRYLEAPGQKLKLNRPLKFANNNYTEFEVNIRKKSLQSFCEKSIEFCSLTIRVIFGSHFQLFSAIIVVVVALTVEISLGGR